MCRSRLGASRVERATGDDGFEGGQVRVSLLTHCCQMTSAPGEGVGSGVAAEAGGVFLMSRNYSSLVSRT